MGVRYRDAFSRDAHSQPAMSAAHRESIKADHPPSSASMIPSSAPRKRNLDAAFGLPPIGESSPAVPASISKPPASRRRGVGPGRSQTQTQIRTQTHHVAATPARPSSRHVDFFATTTPRIAEAEDEDDYDEGAVLASSPVAFRKIAQPRFPAASSGSLAPRKLPMPHVDSGIGMLSSSPPSRGGSGGILAETPRKPIARSRPGASEEVGATIVVATPANKGKTTGGPGAEAGEHGNGKENADGDADGREKGKEKGKGKEKAASPPRRQSIYERLGWDDDFDELG